MRRRVFLGAALLGVAGCSAAPRRGAAVASEASEASVASGDSATRPSPGVAALEKASGARIGVYARKIQGPAVVHRADERFPMCSTFKMLAVAATLQRFDDLGRRVRYSKSDLLDYAPITKKHVKTGLTLEELCDAAIRYSDNTAANLLLEQLGGPAAVTRFARSRGDRVTRLDRTEPTLNTAVPGDPRDTTTPAAYGNLVQDLVLQDGIGGPKRDLLMGWMLRNTTGDAKIRAAVPKGWEVADKTGSGSYGTSNDVALIRPPSADPIVLTVYTTYPAKDAKPDPTLVKRAAEAALKDLKVL